MYYQDETEKKERRRFITFAIATVVLILILIVAIVVVATKKAGIKDGNKEVNNSVVVSDVNTSSENETKTEETKASEENTSEDKKEEVGILSTNTSDAPTVNTVATSNIPTTGPEEILPVALVLGALTTYGASAVMAKREQ